MASSLAKRLEELFVVNVLPVRCLCCFGRKFQKRSYNQTSAPKDPLKALKVRPISQPFVTPMMKNEPEEYETWTDRFRKLENALYLCDLTNTGEVGRLQWIHLSICVLVWKWTPPSLSLLTKYSLHRNHVHWHWDHQQEIQR